MIKNVRRVMLGTGLVLALLVCGAIAAPTLAGASSGFPLYSWGTGSGSRPANTNAPTRVGDGYWLWSSTAGSGSFAISASGHLYAWGYNRNAPNMGQGGSSTTLIAEPTRIGNANNWVMVSSMTRHAAAINDQGHLFRWGSGGPWTAQTVPERVGTASNWIYVSVGTSSLIALNNQGELWSMGTNADGVLGDGTNTSRSQLVRVGGVQARSDWKAVSNGFTYALAVTQDGHLYAWGNNGAGRTGLGTTTGNTLLPTRVGNADNWVDARAANGALVGIALNDQGEIYTWGADHAARGTDSIAVATTPQRMGTANNWIAISGGNAHVHAFASDGQLWGWGNGMWGSVGDGTNTMRRVPVSLLQTYGFATTSRGGGHHAMMLMRTTPAEGESDLVKNLQKPEGTPIPNLNFTFTFERNSFNDNSTRPDLNTILPAIGPVTITIDSSSDSDLDNGVVTLTNSINALANVEFDRAGVFSYVVRETVNSSGTNAAANLSTVAYSQAEYELRVYVVSGDTSGTFEVYTVNAIRRIDCTGTAITPPVKVDDFSFTNIYTRTTTGTNQYPRALTVSKTVVGDFVNLDTVFDFDVTLTRTALCPTNTTFSGRILNQAGTQVGSPITFTSGTQTHVELGHGQRLVFDELVVGTTFTVTERAAPEFRASVLLYVDGTQVTIAPNEDPNTALPIGNHLVGVARNTADFTNAHTLGAPTGLSISNNTPLVIPVAMVITLVAYIAARRRKSIEDLSLAVQ